MRRTIALAATLLLLAPLALAGCLGGGSNLSPSSTDRQAQQATSPPADANNTTVLPTGPWTRTASATLSWVAGAGVPGVASGGLYPTASCPDRTLSAPGNVTAMGLAVSGGAADPNEPGAGAFTLTVTDPSGTATTYAPPQGVQGGYNVTLTPTTGTWEVSLQPTGPAVNHGWTVTMTLQGDGALPGNLTWAASC